MAECPFVLGHIGLSVLWDALAIKQRPFVCYGHLVLRRIWGNHFVPVAHVAPMASTASCSPHGSYGFYFLWFLWLQRPPGSDDSYGPVAPMVPMAPIRPLGRPVSLSEASSSLQDGREA